MILLQDNKTCRQARLILRELIKGDKSRAQLWGSLVDNQLDDVDLGSSFRHWPTRATSRSLWACGIYWTRV